MRTLAESEKLGFLNAELFLCLLLLTGKIVCVLLVNAALSQHTRKRIMATKKTKSLQARVWENLSQIDCSSFTEKKLGLTYLSWANAYSILMDNYPDNIYTFTEQKQDDGTVMITCTIVINEGDESCFREMWLPVMNHKNQAVANPDAFQVNTARMRVFTKCLSMHGLGAYIYAGEDLPQSHATVTQAQVKQLTDLLKASGADVEKFMAVYKIKDLSDMEAGKFNQAVLQLNRKIEQKREAEDA